MKRDERVPLATGRIWEVDFLRGLCIILMVMDHALYDLAFIFRYRWFGTGEGTGVLFWLTETARTAYFPWILRDVVWIVAVFSFVFLCGISCSFSHSNRKRGGRLALIALALTAVTYGLDQFSGTVDQYVIRFGILHLLAVSILLYSFLERVRRPIIIGFSLVAILIGLYFSMNPLDTSSQVLALFVKTRGPFYSADYFPLLPWFGCFLLGAALGPVIYPRKQSLFPRGSGKTWKKPFLAAGRHSLLIYILHQPVVYGLLLLVGGLAF